MRLQHLLFGDVSRHDMGELEAFRHKLLAVTQLAGALFTLIFIAGNSSSINPLRGHHPTSMCIFTAGSVLLWLLLRGHPERFLTVAWVYEALCIGEYVSALAFVPQDEMRIFWFATNIPGVYILLGKQAGLFVTAAIIGGVALGNKYLSAPYSQFAMATFLIGILYLAAFFHVFVDRALHYYEEMQGSIKKLAHMARHDALTGLLNGQAFADNASQMVALMARMDRPYAILFVDLDHFKRINDEHGHLSGDIVLQSVAKCLRDTVRDSDLIGRVGGEEFVVFLSDVSAENAALVAEDIRQSIERLNPQINGETLRVTASIGVALSLGGKDGMTTLQQNADQAMYQSKAEGRNRVTLFAS